MSYAIYTVAATCGMYIIHDLLKLVDNVALNKGLKFPVNDSVDQDHRSDRDLIAVRIGLLVDYDLGSDMYVYYRTNLSVT